MLAKDLLICSLFLVKVKGQLIGNITVESFVPFHVTPWSVEDAKIKEMERPSSWYNHEKSKLNRNVQSRIKAN